MAFCFWHSLILAYNPQFYKADRIYPVDDTLLQMSGRSQNAVALYGGIQAADKLFMHNHTMFNVSPAGKILVELSIMYCRITSMKPWLSLIKTMIVVIQ